MSTDTSPIRDGPSRGDFWAKWGVWVGIAALAVAVAVAWLTGFLGTNGRIDALYPTILQQTKDISSIALDLHDAGAKIAAAQTQITAAAEQNTKLTKKLADLTEKQAVMLAKQDDQVATIQEIKKSVNDLSNNMASRLERIEGRIEQISTPLPLRKTDFLKGSYVFGPQKLLGDYGSQFKEFGAAGITPLELDEPGFTMKAFTAWNQGSVKNSFLWLTKDPDAAKAFSGALGK